MENKIISIKQIINLLGKTYTFSNNPSDFSFNNVKPINESDSSSLCWLSPTRTNKNELLKESKSKVIICSHDNDFESNYPDKLFIKVLNPKLVYLRIVREFFTIKPEYGIDKTAIISSKSIIHKESYIGPYCVIGDVKIGKNTFIHENCSIRDNTLIGNNVNIKPNTIIGGDGFGYSVNEHGNQEKFPHIGGVIIEDDVDIGSNTCIDKGTLGNTLISKGAKIDNLVHIAHNVKIGKNSMIIAQAMIGGSTEIGDNSWISPSSCIRDAITIGSNVMIGLGSLVTKSVPDNEIWMGSPARRFKRK